MTPYPVQNHRLVDNRPFGISTENLQVGQGSKSNLIEYGHIAFDGIGPASSSGMDGFEWKSKTIQFDDTYDRWPIAITSVTQGNRTGIISNPRTTQSDLKVYLHNYSTTDHSSKTIRVHYIVIGGEGGGEPL